MITPRSLFTVLVLAQLAVYAIGSISGSVMGLIQELLGVSAVRIGLIGGIDIGGFLASVLGAVVTIVIGVLLLGLLLRVAWPMASRFLKLELPGQKEQSDR